MKVLENFYLKTRPWGFWQPVYQSLKEKNPELKKNEDFKRDMLNVAVGLVWHTSLTCIGILLVIKQWDALVFAVGVAACTSLLLKKNWYERLQDEPDASVNDEKPRASLETVYAMSKG